MKLIRSLVALVLLGLAAPALARPATPCAAEELRVMTYNIRLDTEADGANRWANRRGLLVGQVRLLHPALLGMQEVLPGQRADLAADLAGYAALGGGRDDGKLAGEASPLFVERARFRIGANGMFWLSPTPDLPSLGWDAAFRRVATWAHLTDRMTGRRILAVSTHWDHVGTAARLNGALLLRQWIADHLLPGEAALVLGDFNAPLAEASVQAMLSPGLRDARGAAIEPVQGGAITFNGWQAVPTSGDAIDHVLIGPEFAVRRFHVLAEHFDGRLASDHFPVIADLVLAPGATGCAAPPRG